VQAGPGKVSKDSATAMLSGDHMVNLERQRIIFGWQMAIFTFVARQSADPVRQFAIHFARHQNSGS